MSSAADLTSKILRYERAILAVSLAVLVGLAWWFIAAGAGISGHMAMAGMSLQPPLSALIIMWWLMMMAMMLPSAAPTILLYASVHRRHAVNVAQPWVFALGYAMAWLFFSVVAAAIQRLVVGTGMALTNQRVAGALLIVAGLYQWSPLKKACLRQCRSPAEFLSRHWRPGAGGALRLGALHGAYCVGCCWLIMALLFVVGVMNIVWIVALTLAIAVEKLVPRGEWVGRAASACLIVWGSAVLL